MRMYEIEILVKLGDGNVMKDYESDTNPYKALLKAMNMLICLLLMSWNKRIFNNMILKHICEVCGKIEVLMRINNEPLSILPNSDDGLSN